MKRIGEVMAVNKNELGFEPNGFDMARRDVTTVSNLIDHNHTESAKAYELMREIKEYNQAYRGNKDVLEILATINLNSSDASDFLRDDKQTLGILNSGVGE
ncbi:hypothetical protein [Companilactobacillus sp. FL22-1]|uniref:hypothetical protein n=1 Tax=Companilactobacillus sp. FL22-1 TaxID=3373892 RepID=UPI003754EE96